MDDLLVRLHETIGIVEQVANPWVSAGLRHRFGDHDDTRVVGPEQGFQDLHFGDEMANPRGLRQDIGEGRAMRVDMGGDEIFNRPHGFRAVNRGSHAGDEFL